MFYLVLLLRPKVELIKIAYNEIKVKSKRRGELSKQSWKGETFWKEIKV